MILKLHAWSQEIWSKNVIFKCKNYVPHLLEYIITLVVVKNKVRLKKCLKKFHIWQSSILQINLSITSLRLIPKYLWHLLTVTSVTCLQADKHESSVLSSTNEECVTRKWTRNSRYYWSIRPSAGGLLVPEGIISPVVNVSVLTWFIIYLHVLLKFTDPK
jgi:hypothetical protein